MREELLSVGIDIGTATTQLVFSNIIIENIASGFTVPRVNIVGKEIIFRSAIHTTPLLSKTRIDSINVKKIIEKEYAAAKVAPAQVKTGAVIITGETARKENAAEVLNALSGLAGDFVVATAGPDLESILSGKGAGADKISEKDKCTVVNLDIGGGTTNISVFKRGELVDVGCLDIGGRLIKIANEKIAYVADKIKRLATQSGIEIEEGEPVQIDKLRLITTEMAKVLEQSVGLRESDEKYAGIITNKGLGLGYAIDKITFSGGVADCVYNIDEDPFKYGDIGVLFGEAIRNSLLTKKLELKVPRETIRATVIGAGAHTTNISGSTINYSKDVFPLKNIPILRLTDSDELLDSTEMEKVIRSKIKWFCTEHETQQIILAMKGKNNPGFSEVIDLAKTIIAGFSELTEKGFKIIVILENDIAKVLGQTICRIKGNSTDVVSIDNICVDNGDYIDIGKPLANGTVVPVVIKTLVFK